MISVSNLKKTHINNKKNKVLALNGVNLELGSKGLVFLSGVSGSGKSTLLSILGGLDSFDSGEFSIDGKSMKNLSLSELDNYRSKDIAFVFQI